MLPVPAINALTARWTALTGVGVWPLLAILADAVDGDARGELAAAAGIDPITGARVGSDIISWLADTPGLSGAIGVWHRDDLPIRQSWRSTLPAGVVEEFGGDPVKVQALLDAWAADRTGGLILTMPVTVSHDTLLLLATALTISTTWTTEFRELGDMLARTTFDPTIVRVTDDITCVRVEGDNGIDVELVIGAADASPADILEYGIGILDGSIPSRSGTDLGKGYTGPGIRVTCATRRTAAPHCEISVHPFTIRVDHNLRHYDDIFGLTTLGDTAHGHLTKISPQPLAVAEAAQSIVAEFSAEGFRAAAVTAVMMWMGGGGGARDDAGPVLVLDLRFDRSFGFLARHRTTGLILAAGWVPIDDDDLL